MAENKIHKVMFLCTGNSCRSQMAEGFARELGRGVLESFSAGLIPCYVHPRAIEVMNEVGIDISQQESKAIDDQLLKQMDLVITLCEHADAACPATPEGNSHPDKGSRWNNWDKRGDHKCIQKGKD
jgi:arsenate reductase